MSNTTTNAEAEVDKDLLSLLFQEGAGVLTHVAI
jgi:hypothetical protein